MGEEKKFNDLEHAAIYEALIGIARDVEATRNDIAWLRKIVYFIVAAIAGLFGIQL